MLDVSRLYPEVLALIFECLDVRDKGRAAQVCSAWREAAYHRSVWRGVEAKLHLRRPHPALFHSLVQRGILKVQVLSLRKGLQDLLVGMPNLESLNLTGCYNLTDDWFVKGLNYDMPTLSILSLSMCKQITDVSLRRISEKAKNLQILDLGGCGIATDAGLLLVAWGLTKLRRLNLRSCKFTDTGIGFLAGTSPHVAAGCLHLNELCLQDCEHLTDDGLRQLSVGLNELTRINLSFCAKITDSGLKHLARITTLKELNLRSCDGVTDVGLAYLAEHNSKIQLLDVSFCDKVGDDGLLHISQGLFSLKSLSLNACNITDEGLFRIARTLSDLRVLHIGQCSRVTDKGLGFVAEYLQRLVEIDLYGCVNSTTVGLEAIMHMPKLQIMNLRVIL